MVKRRLTIRRGPPPGAKPYQSPSFKIHARYNTMKGRLGSFREQAKNIAENLGLRTILVDRFCDEALDLAEKRRDAALNTLNLDDPNTTLFEETQ